MVKNNRGNALPMVLFFAAVGMITVFTYLLNQLSIAKPSLKSPANVQALLNARSGIYKAFLMLSDSTTTVPDTLAAINTLDSAFGQELFDQKDSADGTIFNSTPTTLELFKNDSFGSCDISLTPDGSFFVLQSSGKFRSFQRHVQARLGGKIPALPDTVLIYYNEDPWEGEKPDGTVISLKMSPKEMGSELLNKLITEYKTQLQIEDSTFLAQPLTIHSNHDLPKIKDTISGPLFIDGSVYSIKWKADRKIIVLGDLQITGNVKIENIQFIVDGDIKIFDETDITGGTLYTNNSIFIGDLAKFKGNALSLKKITVFGNAQVKDKSTLTVANGGTNSTNSDSSTSKKDTSSYSLYISDNASVDATCMALQNPGSIKTDKETTISGILYAQNTVCHRGTMQGLIRASRVINCDDPGELPPVTSGTPIVPSKKNSLPGELSPLKTITEYPIPFFAGPPSIIEWKEK